jgi:Flp pilus assembly protein TadD
MFRGAVLSSAILAVALALSGCAHDQAILSEPLYSEAPLETSALPETVKLVAEGKRQYSEGHYGLAVDAFAKSVEIDALNPEAWLGLAASYDQIGRFDAADKAYNKVQTLIGQTPSVLNNLGYSYLLRGNLDKARGTLAAAYHGDPGNPYIVNNIDILNQRLVTLGQPPMVMNN